MRIETLKQRIAGKEKEITKLEKKLERILKAKESNWENNPYYYDERDLKYTERDLEEAKERLEKYNADLEEAEKKAASRNVKPILEFLNQWKAKTKEYYVEMFPEYKEALEAYYEERRKHSEKYSWGWRIKATPEERKAADREYRELEKSFSSAWTWITPYVDRSNCEYILDEEKLTRDLNAEADRKYDFIIERTVEVTGTITDASNLRIGKSGELNGFIIGEDGTAKVQTIGAGGWNIQRYHFRTLIHKQ